MSKTYFVRTEPRATSGDLEAGLAARVYDPLWLLARQWQIGELLGEDAGSPVAVNVAAETAMLDHFTGPEQARAVEYDPTLLPLDVLAGDPVRTRAAEEEPAAEEHATTGDEQQLWTARLRVDTGRAFLRALADGGVGSYREAYRAKFPIRPPDAQTQQADPAGARLLAVAAGRIPDGEALYRELSPTLRGGGALPATPVIPTEDLAGVRSAAQAWLAWCDDTLAETGPSSWVDEKLEHRFSVASGTGAGATVLEADGYRGESLDWHSFDVRPAEQPSGFTSLASFQALPTGVRFRGMPNARWWEFEDASVDLGSVDAGPSDVARLALLEFGLVYANDFFAVPLRLPVGSLCRITSLVVADTFGMHLQIGPAAQGPNRQGASRWSMFTLNERQPSAPGPAGVSDLFFLPPVANQIITSEPVEEVLMLRDEMANLAWAVERRYEGETGAAVERVEEMTRTMPERPTPGEDATLTYTLGTTVPPYWFPLVPEASTGEVRLRLEQMVARDATVKPRGRFLVLGSPPIPDGDVPREGTRLIRDYTLTRWANGATYVWARRIRRVGRGEGSSGLRFDLAEYTET
jgi:hypothetical protein